MDDPSNNDGYTSVIKEPMYLRIIQTSLKKKHYGHILTKNGPKLYIGGSWEHFWADVRLIASNAREYNAPSPDADPADCSVRMNLWLVACADRLDALVERMREVLGRDGDVDVMAAEFDPGPAPEEEEKGPRRKR